jgi:hypothetical protein
MFFSLRFNSEYFAKTFRVFLFKEPDELQSPRANQIRMHLESKRDTGVSLFCLEGLSFLMRSHLAGMPAHACFVLYLTPTSPFAKHPRIGKAKGSKSARIGSS